MPSPGAYFVDEQIRFFVVEITVQLISAKPEAAHLYAQNLIGRIYPGAALCEVGPPTLQIAVQRDGSTVSTWRVVCRVGERLPTEAKED